MQPAPGFVQYLHTNAVGLPNRITDSSGGPIWQAEEFPFGDIYTQSGSSSTPLRFPGQYDEGGGSYQNVWRNYFPALGRYSQPDPLGLHRAGSHAGANLVYGYADNRPTGLTDPRGLYVPTAGCSQAEHDQIQRAGAKAEAAAKTCLPCGEIPHEWALRIRHTVWNCDHRGSDEFCAIHGKPLPGPPYYDQTTGHDISVGPGGLGESKFCGCLQATMLHEVAHYFGYEHGYGGSKNAYDIEKPCFSCAGEKPGEAP